MHLEHQLRCRSLYFLREPENENEMGPKRASVNSLSRNTVSGRKRIGTESESDHEAFDFED